MEGDSRATTWDQVSICRQRAGCKRRTGRVCVWQQQQPAPPDRPTQALMRPTTVPRCAGKLRI